MRHYWFKWMRLITRYSDKMASTESQFTDQRIILDNEKQLDIAELFELKNSLIRDIERKKLELQEQKDAISIIILWRTAGSSEILLWKKNCSYSTYFNCYFLF